MDQELDILKIIKHLRLIKIQMKVLLTKRQTKFCEHLSQAILSDCSDVSEDSEEKEKKINDYHYLGEIVTSKSELD